MDKLAKVSAETFEALVANAPDFILVVDRARRIIYVNRVVPPLTQESVVGQSVELFVNPEDQDKVLAAITTAFETGEATSYETTGPGEHGETHYYHTRVGTIPAEAGAECVSLIATDITQRKNAEIAAERERRILDGMNRVNRVLANASSIDGMLENVLGEMLDIFACDRAWLLRPCDPAAPMWTVEMERTRPDWPGAAELKTPLPASDYSSAVFERVLSTDGACVFAAAEGTLDAHAEVIEMFGIRSQMVIAIHPKKSAEAWCLGIHHCEREPQYTWQVVLFEAIGQRIADSLTALLSLQEQARVQAQLVQAQKMESLGQLTGGVAHDFNNLLTVVLANVDMVAMSLEGQPESELLDNAIDAATRAAALTQRLLAFSRKQALKPQTLDLHGLVVGVEEMLRRLLGETIEIKVSGAADLWACQADPSQLENAILNLAINARDAMPNGGKLTLETANIHVEWKTHQDIVAGQYVQLVVTDNGSGIPAEVLARVFEPFFTTKETGSGSGLGLSMVFGFAKQSGGHIKLYSEVGVGTSAKLYLPRSFGAVTQPSVPAEGPDMGERELILVVEDEPSVQEIAVRLLETLNYKTIAVLDAQKALEVLAERDVDLLFTDVVLPGGVNGVELSERARAICPDLPVLFTSGYTANAIVHNGQLDAAVDLLEKPYTRATLARAIFATLQRTRSVR